MPTDDQIIQRLRASLHRESAGIDLPPNLITTIRHELLTNTDPENRRRRARTPGAVFVGLTTAVALAVALIAIVLINHGHFAPHGEPATFAPGTAAIVAQTPDSQPGLPWGLRAFQASRNYMCVQVGRLQGGAIGAIGRDGAFSDDGRFHPIPSTDAGRGYCVGDDAHGHAFVNVRSTEMPASALTGSGHGGCQAEPLRLPPQLRRRLRPTLRQCQARDLRNVSFGLLGPDATSITYRSPDGQTVTKPTGPDGAYLVVSPGTQKSCLGASGRCVIGGGEITTAALLPGVITAVTYRDGHVCRLPNTGPTAGAISGEECRPVGWVPTPLHPQDVTAAQVATTVTGRAILSKYYCFPRHTRTPGLTVPCDGRVPHGDGRGSGESDGMLTNISFTARLAATNFHSVYEFSTADPNDPRCPINGGGTDGTTMTPIRAGQHVVIQDFENGCPGRYTGLVTYQPNGYPGRDTLSAPGPIRDGSTLVGRFSFVVSCGRHRICRGVA